MVDHESPVLRKFCQSRDGGSHEQSDNPRWRWYYGGEYSPVIHRLAVSRLGGGAMSPRASTGCMGGSRIMMSAQGFTVEESAGVG